MPAPSPQVLVLEREAGLLGTLPRYLPGPYRHRVVSSIAEAFAAMAAASAPYGGLITDAHSGNGDIFEWIAESRRAGWTGQVLMSSANTPKDLPNRAARVGAGFVRKDGNHARVSARYRSFLHWVAIARRLKGLLHEHGEAHGLSAMEQAVLDLAPWIRASLIYETLGRSPGTVRTQISSIVRKTGDHDLNRVVSSALAYGYIETSV